MKKCFKCGFGKPLSEFYRHPKMGDGHLNKCKECTRLDSKERSSINLQNPAWYESEKERHREKYYRLGYKEKHKPTKEARRETTNRYIATYPEKHKATTATANMSRPGFHCHHWSYNEEHRRDVIFIRPSHHALVHRFMKYDRGTFFYRTLDNVLLNTKEAHISHIKAVFSLNGIMNYF